MEGILNRIQQSKDFLSQLLGDRLLREYRAEKETLLREMAFLSKITELKDHRAKLEDGKPCPLCGAKEHPFAEGNVPIPDETERKADALAQLIYSAEALELAIGKLEEEGSESRKKLADADPAKVGEELHATLNAAQTGVRSALTQIQPVLVQLIEHGQANGVDHAPTMVGCLNQIIRDCEYLRETYGLPREAPTDATPAWLKDEN